VLHKEIPFLRIVIPLCTGIISGLYIETGPGNVIAIAAFIIVTLSLTKFLNKGLSDIPFGLYMTISLILFGHLMYSYEKNSFTKLNQEETDILCTLSDYPEERENSYRTKVRLNGIIENDLLRSVQGSLLLYVKKDLSITALLPGDLLKIRCIPEEISNRGNPCEFNYKFYMENQGIRYVAFISKNDIRGHIVPVKRKINHKALIIRERIIEMYRNRGITGRKLALVAAITVGEKTMLEPEQKDNFIRAGVMHIMAVSGLHAVVLSLFVFNILFFLKGRLNILRILAALIILWAFSFVTGLTPSVMRATLMFSFIQAGNLMKRPANSMNSVLASAFVLILIRPSVIFDAGFLLSYSAVIFIIAFYRDLYIKIHLKSWLADKIWQSVVVTLVAQAGTLPLTVMLFNRFPAYFILTNIIIVPLSSLLIITGCLIPMLYPVVFLSRLLGIILSYMTGLTEFLTKTAASLPGSTIERIGMTVPECMLMTGVISLLCLTLINREFRAIKYLLFLVLWISCATTAKDISIRRSDELIVYNVQGATIVGIRTGKTINLYSQEGKIPDEVLRHSSTLDLNIETFSSGNAASCIKVAERRILITNSISKALLAKVSPDIVILAGTKPNIKDCSGVNKYPEMVILSSETATGFRISADFANLLLKPVHNTRKSGAFKMIL
jgi:competence protein ComEC